MSEDLEYVGFRARVGAALIDSVLVFIATVSLLVGIYGWAYFGGQQTGFIAGLADFLISWVSPAAASPDAIRRTRNLYISFTR